MNEGTGYAIEILLVEDNIGDVRLTKEALSEAKVPNRLHVAQDGVAALQFLRKEQPYSDSPHPDLVLLDLNLPKKSGLEVLAQIKQDPALREGLINSRFHSEICLWGGHQGESAGSGAFSWGTPTVHWPTAALWTHA
ncbi:MAG TPA: response regulator, partial [Nitrospira sp.]|nr:response regulator [Nitrospira sp.]